jgi:hypothetical protein
MFSDAGFHEMRPLLLSDFNKTGMGWQISTWAPQGKLYIVHTVHCR